MDFDDDNFAFEDEDSFVFDAVAPPPVPDA